MRSLKKKQEQSQKQRSLRGSYTWEWQYWLTGKDKHQLCANTGYSLRDLLKAMEDWGRWLESVTYSYADAYRNIFKKTSGHSSLEKYTSHFIERVVWEGVGDRTKTATYSLPPQLFWLTQPFFPVLLGCSTGGLRAWEPSLCWDMVLVPESSLQLIWTSCRRGYIIIWCPPTSCERYNSHSIPPVDSQGHPLISSTGCTCYLHKCISHLTARPGRRSICNKRKKENIMLSAGINDDDDDIYIYIYIYSWILVSNY